MDGKSAETDESSELLPTVWPIPTPPSTKRGHQEQWICMTVLPGPQQPCSGHKIYLMGDLQPQGTREESIFSRMHQCLRETLSWSAKEKWLTCTTTCKWGPRASHPPARHPSPKARLLAWSATNCEEHAAHGQAIRGRGHRPLGGGGRKTLSFTLLVLLADLIIK